MKRQTVKKLIQCVAIIAAGVLAIILFMLAIWCRGKNSEPVTDEQVAAQMQQAEPLVIETPEAAAEGSIRVYDYDGCCIYAYYGKIRINNDGKDGKDIDVEAMTDEQQRTYLESIRRTRFKTLIMTAHIDKAVEEIERRREAAGRGVEYKAFEMYFMQGMDYAEIAEELDTGKNTPRRWVTGIINELSVLLWGIDEERVK